MSSIACLTPILTLHSPMAPAGLSWPVPTQTGQPMVDICALAPGSPGMNRDRALAVSMHPESDTVVWASQQPPILAGICLSLFSRVPRA